MGASNSAPTDFELSDPRTQPTTNMDASSSAPTDLENPEQESPSLKRCILGIDVGKKYRILGSCNGVSLDNYGCIDLRPLRTGSVSRIMGTKDLLGQKFSDPELQSELHSFYLVEHGLDELYPVIEGSDGFPLFKYQGELISATKLVAKEITECKAAMVCGFNNEKLFVSDCCVGIPVYFTYQQRRELLHAVTTAGLTPRRLLHQTTATALSYRSLILWGEYPMNVAFIYADYSGMQISIVEINTDKLKVLSHAHDESLGERAFTDVLFKYFSAKFEVNTSDMKTMCELHMSCKNLKNELKSEEVASLSYLNFNEVMKRTEFDELSSSLLQRVNVLLQNALKRAGFAVKDAHEMVVISGGSKIPAIKNIFENFFNKKPIESSWLFTPWGCLIQCAMLCGASNIPVSSNFQIIDIIPYSVILDDMTNRHVVFYKGTTMPNKKNVTFLHSSTFFLDLLYINPDDPEDSSEMILYMIGPFESCDGPIELNVVVLVDLHGISYIESATMGDTIIPVVEYSCPKSRAEHFKNLEKEQIEIIQKAERELIDASTHLKSSLNVETKKRIEIEKTLEAKTTEQQLLQQSKDAVQLQLTKTKTLLETTTKQHKELQTLRTSLRNEIQQAHKELDNMLVHLNSSINEETKRRIQIEKTLQDKISEQAGLHETTTRKHVELQTALKHELDVETRRRIEVEERLGRARGDYEILHEQWQIEREEKLIVSKIVEDQIFFGNEHNAAQLEANRKQHKDLETTLQNKVQKAEEELAVISEQLKNSINVRTEIEKTLKGETSEQQKLRHSMAELKRQLVESETLLETTRKQHEELENTHRNEVQKLDDISAKLKSALDVETKRRIEIEKSLEVQKSEHMKSHEIERKVIEERDNDFIEADEWRLMIEGQSSSGVVNFKIFSLSELERATNNFNKSLIIGEGGYGYVYKGYLRHKIVAIKIPKPESSMEAIKFNQEVEILTKVRHPNLVLFIGACLKAQALIFEFLPNGGLDSYLSNGKNNKKLLWQERIRIASEICSALMFLHSIPPHGIAHGDLKPENILLDSNYVSKLADFGISRILQETTDTTTPFHETLMPKFSPGYGDPEFFSTCKLSPKCDIYSLGIIILQLVTGRGPVLIKDFVEDQLKAGTIDNLVDSSAGEWPIEVAKKLAEWGLQCSDQSSRKRPHLVNELWPSIESMKHAAGL